MDDPHYDEPRARTDLAAALRWASRLGFGEGVCNHFSLALPGRTDRFLINPQGLHWSASGAFDLVVVDAHGRKITGRHNVEPTAFFIHGALHRGKPSARCVLHTHMPYATSLTIVQGGRLEWASQNALKFYGRIAYDDDYNGLALDDAEGERMCGRLGDAEVLFLANHGVIVVGPSVAEAFDLMYYLERACRLQVLARSMGGKLKPVRPEVIKTAYSMMREDAPKYAGAHFSALKRILDREEPGYSR